MTTLQDTGTEHPFVLVGTKGLAYVGLHKDEASCWMVALGWPDADEIAHRKAQGFAVYQATLTWQKQAVLASRDEAAQQPQGQAVSDEQIVKVMNAADEYAQCAAKAHVESLYGTSKSYTAECTRFENEARTKLQAILAPAMAQQQWCPVSDGEIDYVLLQTTGFDGMGTQEMNSGDLHRICRAILALRDKSDHFPGATKMMPLSDDFATIAGLESAVGHLSTLVDEQRALLVESEDVFGRDGHGGRYEDGECNLIDRIRAHLEMTAPPPNGITAKEQGNGN